MPGFILSVLMMNRLRAQSGAFTRFTRTKLQIQTGAFTGFIWDILGANRQIFTPLHSNVSSWVRAVFERIKPIQRNIFFDVVFDTGRSDSNPVRNTNENVRTFTNPDGGIWYTRLFSITPLHSNVSSWVRTVFEPCQTHSKRFDLTRLQESPLNAKR